MEDANFISGISLVSKPDMSEQWRIIHKFIHFHYWSFLQQKRILFHFSVMYICARVDPKLPLIHSSTSNIYCTTTQVKLLCSTKIHLNHKPNCLRLRMQRNFQQSAACGGSVPWQIAAIPQFSAGDQKKRKCQGWCNQILLVVSIDI
jgi:hypothetical protein